LNDDNDTACAIVTTSYLEHMIRAILRAHFINGDTAKSLLDPKEGALALLGNATCVAYCLGLISKGCKANIDRIGHIRNLFAHSIQGLSFQDPDIAAICDKLTFPAATKIADPEEGTARLAFQEFVRTPRGRFVHVASSICSIMMLDLHSVKRTQKRTDLWDA
jgi:hypothetical protein